MRIKTYISKNISEAMDQIRAELGDEAVILSTMEGADGIRVTAALDDLDNSIALVDERPKKKIPGLELVCERLEKHMLPMELSDLLISECAKYGDLPLGERFINSIKKFFHFSPIISGNAPLKSPLMLVGPPGVGKSSVIAKIAYSLKDSGRRIHVITTDAQKAGAIAQMTSFAKALPITIETAEDPSEIASLLTMVDRRADVVIDTPGTNPFDSEDLSLLGQLVLSSKIAPTIVLQAGGDVNEQWDLIDAFTQLGADKLILTKLDFPCRLGGQLDAVYRSGLKLAGYSRSPLIGKGLSNMTPEHLALVLLEQKDKNIKDGNSEKEVA